MKMENNNRKKSYSKQIGNDCPAGLVPPHDVKLEQAVLGAMLLGGALLGGTLALSYFACCAWLKDKPEENL